MRAQISARSDSTASRIATCGNLRDVDDDDLMSPLDRPVVAIRQALATIDDWRPVTGAVTHTQYALDLVADGPAVELLTRAGLGVLSEGSGLHHQDRDV